MGSVNNWGVLYIGTPTEGSKSTGCAIDETVFSQDYK